MSTCSNCKYFRAPQEGQQLGTCQRNPPTAFMVPFRVKPSPGNPEGVITGIQSYFVPVQSDWYCGAFVVNIAKVN